MSIPVEKKISWALALGLMLVHVFPVAADLLVCIDDRPDRGCCEESSAPDTRTEVEARLVDGAECRCCVLVPVVSNRARASVQKVDVGCSVAPGVARGRVAPISRRMASAGSEEFDNPRLPSLRAVVLLI